MTSLTSSSLPFLNLLNVFAESTSMTWWMMIDVMIDDDNQLVNTSWLTGKHPSLKTTKMINILFIINTYSTYYTYYITYHRYSKDNFGSWAGIKKKKEASDIRYQRRSFSGSVRVDRNLEVQKLANKNLVLEQAPSKKYLESLNWESFP